MFLGSVAKRLKRTNIKNSDDVLKSVTAWCLLYGTVLYSARTGRQETCSTHALNLLNLHIIARSGSVHMFHGEWMLCCVVMVGIVGSW